MRITGRLKNVSGSGKDDVFAGYAVELRYFVVADAAASTYQAVDEQLVLQGSDPGFVFQLSDTAPLGFEQEVRLVARNRSGEAVGEYRARLVELVRTGRAVEIPIQRIEPEVVLTPVNLRGRLRWKQSGKTDSFEGFLVRARFFARESAEDAVLPRQATMTPGASGTFQQRLPAQEWFNPAQVTVVVTYPDGGAAVTQSYALSALKEEIVLVVDTPATVMVRTDGRVAEGQPERLKGKVVDLAGKVQIAQRQVIVWGARTDGAIRPLLVTQTDGLGNFGGERPKDRVSGLWATVSGTRQATLQSAAAIDLVEQSDAEETPRTGRVPSFIYLVVEQADEQPDKSEECGCESTPPRQPDPEDLVSNATAYSQDIGLNCVNFTTPNRTLEEFVYSLVVRTTDPEIKGTTLADLDRRPSRAANVSSMADARYMTVVSLKTTPTLAPVAKLKTEALTTRDVLTADPSAVWKNLYKTVPGRGELSVTNSVDWDGTPTFYQATTISHGHVLYYKQNWKADGYSMGDLESSLPLAQGQKKQIVIFDWDRSEYGRRDESAHEDEALNAYLGHTRDVRDITSGRVAEQMRGGSKSDVSGSAGGFGGGVGALVGTVAIGVAGGFSASSGSSSSSAWQDSSRDDSASGLNQLRDMVQQGASAVRNQRSTVVQAARQAGRFRVETEVVANHNHCHAITVQYFEVLRHYTIEQQLTHVQECLFIPLLMSPFNVDKVMRWRDVLRPSLLLWERPQLTAFGEHPLIRGIEAAERIFLQYNGSEFPKGTYAAEPLVNLEGELWISFRLNRPRDADDDAQDPARQEDII